MFQQQFRPQDRSALRSFFLALNQNTHTHINWNWARFEWMYEHPDFDRSAQESIGLWWEDGHIVAAAVYDLYFGEAFCGTLPGYQALFPAVLDYAYAHLRDENGLSIALCDTDSAAIRMAAQQGFAAIEQGENLMRIPLAQPLAPSLPEGLHFTLLDPAQEPERFQWILWQGFDHGTDWAVFARQDVIRPQKRLGFLPQLSIAATDVQGEDAAYCCLWYDPATNYAYVEPVCTVPRWRGRGVGRAVVCEALNRARGMGAAQAYVISDMDFYVKMGFANALHYTFYRKG